MAYQALYEKTQTGEPVPSRVVACHYKYSIIYIQLIVNKKGAKMAGKMTSKEAEAWAKEHGLGILQEKKIPVILANKKRREVLDWAKRHNFIINPDGYEYYVESWFMFKYCPCDKTRKSCPCIESVEEVKRVGYCKCHLFWLDYEIFKDKNLPV